MTWFEPEQRLADGLWGRIRNVFTPSVGTVDGSSAVSSHALWQTTSRIGGNLTPEQV
ncbi:unnamed protein product, partial [marine sediment metagenome]